MSALDITPTIPERPKGLPVSFWIPYVCIPVLCLMCLRIMSTGPLVHLPLQAQAAYNEGYNAYRAAYVATGVPLYGRPIGQCPTNYPPISFWVAGILSHYLGGVNTAGRWISIVSWLLVSVELGFIVVKLGGELTTAAYCGLMFLFLTSAFAPSFVATNDPQMLGHALVMAGVALYVWRSHADPWVLAVCAIVICFGLFVKQNLLVFPIAITIDLWLWSRKRLAIWVLSCGATLASLAAISIYREGPYFLEHLLAPRTYSFGKAGVYLGIFCVLFQLVFTICLVWAAVVRKHLLAWALYAALGLGFVFSGGGGTYVNMAFEMIVVLCLICALAVGQRDASTMSFPRMRHVIAAAPLVILVPALGLTLVTTNKKEVILQDAADYRADVNYIKSRPGDAICENLLLCFDSGKPLVYDPFWTKELILVGRIQEQTVLNALRSHRYSVIQIDLAQLHALLPLERDRFTRRFMETLLSTYREDRRHASRVFLVPR